MTQTKKLENAVIDILKDLLVNSLPCFLFVCSKLELISSSPQDLHILSRFICFDWKIYFWLLSFSCWKLNNVVWEILSGIKGLIGNFEDLTVLVSLLSAGCRAVHLKCYSWSFASLINGSDALLEANSWNLLCDIVRKKTSTVDLIWGFRYYDCSGFCSLLIKHMKS